MHDPGYEPPTPQREMTTTATQPARYPVGPSKGRSNEGASAPGVAEGLGHQGVPEEDKLVETPAIPLPRAADAAALHRVARRRQREPVQRKERVDVRYSTDEKTAILAKARSLNIAGAHYVGAVVMAHLHGDLALPGQRTPLDDYIDELTALRREVAWIGHNINQITKKLNSGGHPHPGDSAMLAQVEPALDAVGATVGHIASAANQAVAKKSAR
ncbi:plasmid mobilization relaxosome protein MobC [Streptomyces sp. MBT53]|uniref:plasmid mobilization relaxosome protein MobC n=1 Tax=Streptomyces sp. MBT53 TaxID=1488384 RepID=UPI001914C40A|nr:plasmid mobilization relaxosome protein MobC [Streptomyces sp. MBT53]MBK6017287.1 plasmid mobilization relaxosome protein MobC [Streptomyces sp. MBT53]